MHKDTVWTLQFYVNYYRDKQHERLDAHLEKNGSLNSFLMINGDAERDLDSLIESAQKLLDEIKAQKTAPKKRRLFKRK